MSEEMLIEKLRRANWDRLILGNAAVAAALLGPKGLTCTRQEMRDAVLAARWITSDAAMVELAMRGYPVSPFPAERQDLPAPAFRPKPCPPLDPRV